MLITETDLINLRIRANAGMTDSQILTLLISEHRGSKAYKNAQDGVRYYSGDQDIKSHSFRTGYIEDANGTIQPFTNPNASNTLTQHRFLKGQIEQKISYITGKEPSVAVDGARPGEDEGTGNDEWRFQEELGRTTDAKFYRLLTKWARMVSQQGVAWLHEYKDRDGRLRQAIVGLLDGIPIYDSAHEQDLVQFIRVYEVDDWVGTTKTTLTKAEWWTPTQVSYWISRNGGAYILDPDHKINPEPHYWEVTFRRKADGISQEEVGRTPKAWGRVPFVEWSNNSDKTTDLADIKDLIDAYDLVASRGTNNLMDFNEFWALVVGLGGDAANALMKKLQINHSASVTSATGGSIEMKQLDLQMPGRIDWLKQLWDSIHTFGCAVDVTNDKLGNAPSGISLKFQYTLLDLKANKMITEGKLALEEHFRFITEEFNRQGSYSWDPEKVTVTFNKTLITNDLETVQMIAQSDGLVPERVLLAAHPLVDDADQAYKDLLEQRKRRLDEQQSTFARYGSLIDDKDEGDGNGAAE